MTKAVKKVTRKLLKSEIATNIISNIISAYLKFVGHTTRWQINGLDRMNEIWDKEKSIIILTWHGRAALAPFFWNKKHPLFALVSEHKDGRLMAKIIRHYGLKLVDGSTTSHSGRAAVKLMKTLQEGNSICLTPDGPVGPSMHMNLSPLVFAQKSGKAIFCITYSIKNAFTLKKSWDEMMFPFPFSKGTVNIVGPFYVPETAASEELENIRKKIESEFVASGINADVSLGRTPVRPGTKIKKKKNSPYIIINGRK